MNSKYSMNSKYYKYLIITLSIILSSILSYSQTDTIKIDIGSTQSAFPWNNLTNTHSGQINKLLNSQGYQTMAGIAVVDAFAGINTAGTQAPNPVLGFPSTASEDSFFGNTELFGNGIEPTGGVELNNLDTNKLYNIIIFSSRIATDNRETKYVITGHTIDIQYLDVSSNTDSVVESAMYPASDGTITVIASPGPNNNNEYGFFYLGAMMVIYEQEEPGPPALSLVSPMGGEFWQIEKQVNILWDCQNLSEVMLDYSIDGGATWENIDTVPAAYLKYEWLVPGPPSYECLVRITSDSLTDASESYFVITDDTTSCHIVVLGSSTAAGAGASVSDSAWVNRYRNVNYQQDTRISVANLAMGGYTTYHLLPTGTYIPPGVGFSIDTSRNITKALSLDPYAVIINLPSNDASNYITVEQQLENFGLIVGEANANDVDTWVCTTQPKSYLDPTQLQIQKDMRDSIFSIYGEYAIDFWNGLADTNGSLLPAFDYGDGTHLNDAGHRLLFERVMDKSIDTLCHGIYTGIYNFLPEDQHEIKVYPNPFQNSFFLEFESMSSCELEAHIYDVMGRMLYSMKKDIQGDGLQCVKCDLPVNPANNPRMLFARIYLHTEEENIISTSSLVQY